MNQRISVVILSIELFSDQKIMCNILPLLHSQSLLITSVLFVSCVLLFPLTLLCTKNLAIYVR